MIKKALQAGHTLAACQATINEARQEASPDRTWYGLAHYKFSNLIAVRPTEAVLDKKPGLGIADEDKMAQRRSELRKQMDLLSDAERKSIRAEAESRAAVLKNPSPGIIAEFELAVYAEMVGVEI